MDKLNHIFSHGHDYVQIGNTKWATMNVGAKSVTDVGLFFAWGDIIGDKPYNGGCMTKKTFNGDTYKWAPIRNPKKYNENDNLTTLQPEDDPVHAQWRGGWRTPTIKEFSELLKLTKQLFTENYKNSGVGGFIFIYGDKELFFPLSGYVDGLKNVHKNALGAYWLSNHDKHDHACAYYYFFDTGTIRANYGPAMRYFGFPIRGVLAN